MKGHVNPVPPDCSLVRINTRLEHVLCRKSHRSSPTLQVVELTGNAGMSGTFGYEATEENNKNSALCKTVNGGLRILNMNGLGLEGLAIPDCLMGTQSTLEELRLGEGPLSMCLALSHAASKFALHLLCCAAVQMACCR